MSWSDKNSNIFILSMILWCCQNYLSVTFHWHNVFLHDYFLACNVVLQKPQGIYTLRNYGGKINCTASIIFPESFEILSSSIGIIPGLHNHRKPVSSMKSTGVSAITDLILPHVTSKSSSNHMESHASSKNLVEAGLIRQVNKLLITFTFH